MHVNRIAALAIAARTDIPLAGRREILEVLGIIPEGGRELLPDDTRMNKTAPIVSSNKALRVR